MASNAPRQLLRGASCHAPPSRPLAIPSSCRFLPRANPYTHLPLRSYNPRPKQRFPPAPPPPERSAYAQKAEERALLSKLSTLSPDQITALLSETANPPPPGGPPSPGAPTYAPGGSGSNSWRQRLLWPVLFALAAFVLGNTLGQRYIDEDIAFGLLDQFDDLEEKDYIVHTGEERSLAAIVNMARVAALLGGSGMELSGLPKHGVYTTHPSSGLVTYLCRGWMKPGYVIQRGAPVLVDPDITTVIPEGAHDEKGKVVSWPAHMRLLEKVGITDELAARRKQHLVAGTYASASTLGGIYQIMQDPDTDELSVVVSFGKRMAGHVGIVHPGAIATVLDESMGRLAMRTLPAKTAVTAKLLLRYSEGQYPPTESVFRIRLDVLSKEAAKELEENLRNDAAFSLQDGQAYHSGSDIPVRSLTPSSLGELLPKPVDLDKVQTDRKVWIRARMYGILRNEFFCEAKGLFVVPKDIELEQLGEHW